MPLQSVSSTLNDPTIDGDQEGWWDYVESWVASDTVAAVPVSNQEVPDVTVADFSSYLHRMAPYRTFFAENALELLEQEKEGEVGSLPFVVLLCCRGGNESVDLAPFCQGAYGHRRVR